ncbi:uncharacterized protein [Henckelia pumila]|uniref:uncharacterized protein n=1 Tax=Henckelia pumila TaxID=405737 RepID=UPI003C6E3B5C
MSWFGSNKNIGGHGHNTYNNQKSGELGHVHRPVIVDHNGVEHPIVGYESHNSERYVARSSRTEAVVKYRRFPGMAADHGEYMIPSPITEDLSGRKNEFSPKSHDERVRRPIKDSPWDNGVRFHSPPTKEHHQYYDDDDVRVNNTKGTRPNNMKEQEYHYHDDENNRRNGLNRQGSRSNYLKDHQEYEHANPGIINGYSPPKYSVPISTQKGNDYDTTRGRMAPFGTPPRNELTSHETSKFKPNASGSPDQRFNPQPKIEELGNYHQETIDSTEARRRYGNGAPGAGPYAKTNYSGGSTIDSREAARRYNGVLLTN